MNANKKLIIKKYIDRLGSMRDELQVIKEAITETCTSEQKEYDNLSVKALEGDRGQLMASIIDNLESATDSLECIDTDMDNARFCLTNIVE